MTNRYLPVFVAGFLGFGTCLGGCSEWRESDFSTPLSASTDRWGIETGPVSVEWGNRQPEYGLEKVTASLSVWCTSYGDPQLTLSVTLGGIDTSSIRGALVDLVSEAPSETVPVSIRFDDGEIQTLPFFGSPFRTIIYSGHLSESQNAAFWPVQRGAGNLDDRIVHGAAQAVLESRFRADNRRRFFNLLESSDRVVMHFRGMYFTWIVGGADDMMPDLREECGIEDAGPLDLDVPIDLGVTNGFLEPSDTTTSGPGWIGYEIVDPADGGVIVSASVSASGDSDINLRAYCRDDRTELYIDWGETVVTEYRRNGIYVDITMSRDSEIVHSSRGWTWDEGDNQEATFAPQPIATLKRLTEVDRVRAWVSDDSLLSSSSGKSGTFHVQNGREWIGRIADACGWDLD